MQVGGVSSPARRMAAAIRIERRSTSSRQTIGFRERRIAERRATGLLDSWVGRASCGLIGRISQPMVFPSGHVKIGCWPGSLSLQPVTLQSAALAAPDTPANTVKPSKAAIIVLMIILLQELSKTATRGLGFPPYGEPLYGGRREGGRGGSGEAILT
jgi:hypothetical protein